LSLRVRRRLKPADKLTNLMRDRYGVDVSTRTIYAIERGEQLPRLDLFLVLVAALDTDLEYFYPSIRPDIVARLSGRSLQ
jgi:transcriptional regulator with XRE-family HTH domain